MNLLLDSGWILIKLDSSSKHVNCEWRADNEASVHILHTHESKSREHTLHIAYEEGERE